jgi:hypothetical protein
MSSGLYDTASTILVTPTFTRASTWCSKIGMLQKGTSGFATVRVKGRRRVPKPPTRMSAEGIVL